MSAEKNKKSHIISDENFFSLLIDGKVTGNYSTEEIQEKIESGELTYSDIVSPDRGKSWLKICEHSEFSRSHKDIDDSANSLPEIPEVVVFKNHLLHYDTKNMDNENAITGLAFAGHSKGRSSETAKLLAKSLSDNKTKSILIKYQNAIIGIAALLIVVILSTTFINTEEEKVTTTTPTETINKEQPIQIRRIAAEKTVVTAPIVAPRMPTIIRPKREPVKRPTRSVASKKRNQKQVLSEKDISDELDNDIDDGDESDQEDIDDPKEKADPDLEIEELDD